MGALFSSPKSPPPPPMPAPPPNPPQMANAQQMLAGQNQQARARAAGSMAGTIATSPQGLNQPASTAQKSLLGA